MSYDKLIDDPDFDQDIKLATRHEKTKLIITASIGNFLEVFDFTVYSFFADVIGQVFFKADDPMVSRMVSVSVFGSGFLMRPLGSIIIGIYADLHGRKAALLITIALMALGSGVIGFAPPYSAIGIGAPLLIVIGRLLQGFSAGGEIGAATTLLMESAARRERGFFVCWQFAGQGLSLTCGALFGAILFHYLSEQQLMSWGWRVPFIFSLLIIPVGLYMRAHVDETYSGTDRKAVARPWYPIAEIVNKQFLQFLLTVLMIMPITLLIYIVLFYMPAYLKQVTAVSPTFAYSISAGMGVVMIVFAFVGGIVCDHIPRRKFLAIAILVTAFISSFVMFQMVDSMMIFIVALMVCVAGLGMLMPIQALMSMEVFPRHIRATAMSVSYSAGVMIFGGTAQMIITKLMLVSGNHPMAPFWYLGIMLVVAVFAYAFFHEARHV